MIILATTIPVVVVVVLVGVFILWKRRKSAMTRPPYLEDKCFEDEPPRVASVAFIEISLKNKDEPANEEKVTDGEFVDIKL